MVDHDDGALQALVALGTPFWWPASYQAVPSAQPQAPAGLQQLLPAILVPVLAVLLLAAAAAVWLARCRWRGQQQLDSKPPEPSSCTSASGPIFSAGGTESGVDARSSRDRAGEVCVALTSCPGPNQAVATTAVRRTAAITATVYTAAVAAMGHTGLTRHMLRVRPVLALAKCGQAAANSCMGRR